MKRGVPSTHARSPQKRSTGHTLRRDKARNSASRLLARLVFAGAGANVQEPASSGSDLVALLRSWGTIWTGVTQRTIARREARPSDSAYAASSIEAKGDEMKGDYVAITFHDIPKGLIGVVVFSRLPRRDGVGAFDQEGRRVDHDMVGTARQRHREGDDHRAADQAG